MSLFFFQNSLFYILQNRPAIDAAAVCAIVFQGSSCVFNNPIFNWSIQVAPGGQPITVSFDLLIILKHFSQLHPHPHSNQKVHLQVKEPPI